MELKQRLLGLFRKSPTGKRDGRQHGPQTTTPHYTKLHPGLQPPYGNRAAPPVTPSHYVRFNTGSQPPNERFIPAGTAATYDTPANLYVEALSQPPHEKYIPAGTADTRDTPANPFVDGLLISVGFYDQQWALRPTPNPYPYVERAPATTQSSWGPAPSTTVMQNWRQLIDAATNQQPRQNPQPPPPSAHSNVGATHLS